MTITAVVILIVAVAAASATLLVQRARLAELRQSAAVASANAVTAVTAEPLIDRLTLVRTAAWESVDATHAVRSSVLAQIRDERRAVARQQARKAARAASAGTPATTSPAAASTQPRPSGGLLIGDSVSLGAESCLAQSGYRVDSEVGRQFTTGLDHLRVAAADGLPQTVVLHLGTNGPFSSEGFHEAMSLVGSQRRVVWVTIALPARSQYGFVSELNDMIRSTAAQYDNARIADFARAAAANPSWLAADGIHIAGPGCDGFTRTVNAAVTQP